jgi:hypothetical protein
MSNGPLIRTIRTIHRADAGGGRWNRPLSIAVRRLLGEIGVPLLLLCALDLGFHWYVAGTSDAPLPKLLPSPIESGKYLVYRRLADDDEPLEVLLMGQSQMMRASMGIVRETVARETGRQILGFNFSAPLQSVEFSRRLLEDVLVPIKPPRVLVLGLLPQNLLFEERSGQVDEMTRHLPVFALHTGTLAARLQDLLFRSSEMYRYREVIYDTLMHAPPQIPFWVYLGRNTDRYGDIPIAVPVQPVNQLNPWERRFIDKFAQFDELIAHTDLFKHIGDLARTCRAHGIQLVLLNNAMHPIALQELPHGQDDVARFVAAVHATADAEGVPVLDSAPGGIGPPELFSDAAHPNVAGTRWVSEQIGHFLVESGLLDGRPLAAPTPAAGA